MKNIQDQEYLNLTREQFIEKFPKLSKEDIDFYFPQKRILEFDNEFIGVRKYESLIEKKKQFDNYNFQNQTKAKKVLSELELRQIENFESRNSRNKDEGLKKEISHWERIYNPVSKKVELKEGLIPDKKTIYRNFLISYKILNGVEYSINEESKNNLEPIIKYFSFDKTFFESQNLVKQVGNKNLAPAFNKGLLLIGNVGNGKTSVMKALEYMINHFCTVSINEKWDTAGDWHRIKFKFKTTESLVTDFEYLETQELKNIFFKTYSSGNLFLDDLKKEKKASNYGITDVISEILQKRYNVFKNYTSETKKKHITHGTMNFHNEYPNNIDFAIQECGVKYGDHVYDRIFELFNIVEFKGKSFRK